MGSPQTALIPQHSAGAFRSVPFDLLGLIGASLSSDELTAWRACSSYFQVAKSLRVLKLAQNQIVGIYPYEHFTFFHLGDGRVFAVGSDYDGLLGLGHQNHQLKPAQILRPWGNAKLMDITSDGSYTCFRLDDGRIFASGKNDYGRLGLMHKNTQLTPALLKSIKPLFLHEIATDVIKKLLTQYDQDRGFWRRHFPLIRHETKTVSDLKKLVHVAPPNGRITWGQVHDVIKRDQRSAFTRRTSIRSAVGFFTYKTPDPTHQKKLSATDKVIAELRTAFR